MKPLAKTSDTVTAWDYRSFSRRNASRAALLFTASCWAFVVGGTGCNNQGAEDEVDTIEIGLLVEFEDQADSEEEISKANLAATEINEAGGISIDGKDYYLRFVAADHKGSAAGGVEAVKSLAERGISIVLGPPWSSIVMGDEPDGQDGAALAARDVGTLLVSGSATSPAITTLEDDDLMWRTVPSDALQAEVAADYLLNEKGLSRAAFLARDEAWGRGLSGVFREAFERGGGEIVGSAFYDVTGEVISDLRTHDFDSELGDIFAELPEVVLLINFDEVFQVTNRIVQGGYLDEYSDKPPLFFGTDATFTDDLLANGAPAVLRHMEGTSIGADTESEGFQRLVSSMVDAGLADADTFDAPRYDSAYVVALAIQAAQSTDGTLVKEHLRAVANTDPDDITISVAEWAKARDALLDGSGIDYQGASGPIDFDQYGDATSGFFLVWKVTEPRTDQFVFDTVNTVRFP